MNEHKFNKGYFLVCRRGAKFDRRIEVLEPSLAEKIMAKVTGIGGIFFKSASSHEKLAAWYHENLGIPLETWGGAVFRWPNDHAEDKGVTVWHVADKDTKWFSPSHSSFMINYRVDDLGELIEHLKKNGVEILQGPEAHENGKFAWILDLDGNKVELWEPLLWNEQNKK